MNKNNFLRVVLDTNVLLSTYISPHGNTASAFYYCAEFCTILMSSDTLTEFTRKMYHKKFDSYDRYQRRKKYIANVLQFVEIIETSSVVEISPDPKDNMFLALAVDGRADYLVSGDKKHLQILQSYQGIPIVSPAFFLSRVMSDIIP